MNPVLLHFAAEMLEMCAEHYSNHGCNDCLLPNTPENLAFVREMIAASEFPDDVPMTAEGQLLVRDDELMQYCAEMLRQEIP